MDQGKLAIWVPWTQLLHGPALQGVVSACAVAGSKCSSGAIRLWHAAAGPYTSAERVWAVKVDKAIIIQRYARGCMARRRVARLLAVKYNRDSFEATQASQQSTAETKRRAFEVQRRMHPRTAADFALLNKASVPACAAKKWAAS